MTSNVNYIIEQIVTARMSEPSSGGRKSHAKNNEKVIIKSKSSDSSSTFKESIGKSNVGDIIKSIEMAYHRDWKRQKLEFARSFLSRTWAGIPLPVLSVCGRGTQEIRYSTYLAYFLDQSKSHGLGSRYLDGILAFMGYKSIDTYQAIVMPEKWLGYIEEKQKVINCYCDIVISCDSCLVFIEQKINSAESVNPNSDTKQLERYDIAIGKNQEFSNKEQIRIFLTPTGKISQNSPNWKSLSYTDLATIGIGILHSSGLSSVARENLKRFLIDMVLGPFKKEEIELHELIEYAEKAITTNNFSDRLRFDQLVSHNTMLVNLLMEG